MPMIWRVFYSYSHQDAFLRAELGKFLAPLKQQGKIDEWHDPKIKPGHNWAAEIEATLDSADCILFLVSADFLASEYCFGVEVERALARLKKGEVRVIPILLRPCLWKESRFSELQFLPRDNVAVTSWPSQDDAFTAIANELREIFSAPTPPAVVIASEPAHGAPNMQLVQKQVLAYAHLYEKTRQRMSASPARTQRMEQIFQRMKTLATSSYPLLMELKKANRRASAWQRLQSCRFSRTSDRSSSWSGSLNRRNHLWVTRP
jgi:hypothetical protein